MCMILTRIRFLEYDQLFFFLSANSIQYWQLCSIPGAKPTFLTKVPILLAKGIRSLLVLMKDLIELISSVYFRNPDVLQVLKYFPCFESSYFKTLEKMNWILNQIICMTYSMFEWTYSVKKRYESNDVAWESENLRTKS